MSNADYSLDITSEVCPLTFVKTKLLLEKMAVGEVASIRLSAGEPPASKGYTPSVFAELPRLLQHLEDGCDLVSGWKHNRQDPASKTLPSRLFNRVTAWLTGVRLRDLPLSRWRLLDALADGGSQP